MLELAEAALDETTVFAELRAERELDPIYPVIFFDALRVKIRDEGLVRNKVCPGASRGTGWYHIAPARGSL